MKKTHDNLTERDRSNIKQLGLSEDEYLRRRHITNRAGAVLVASGLTAALLVAGQHSDGKAQRHYDKIEQTSLDKIEEAYNNVIAFHGGVKYRTAPELVDHNASDGPDTVAGVVPEGNVLRVDRAVKYEDKEGNGDFWIGFVEQGDIGSKPTTLLDRTFWVNLSELEREAIINHKSLYEIFYYPAGATDGGPADSWHVTVDSKGRVLGDINGHGGPVAVPQFVSEAQFTDMVTTEQLAFSHGK